MITLTEKAAAKVKELLQRDHRTDSALRVGVKSGGYSDFTYTLDFDTQRSEGDQQFEHKGIQIVVDSRSFLYLAGTELDYTESLTGSGFTFNNPNVRRSCGCGSSFKA